jgi:hypothetical protein
MHAISTRLLHSTGQWLLLELVKWALIINLCQARSLSGEANLRRQESWFIFDFRHFQRARLHESCFSLPWPPALYRLCQAVRVSTAQ